MIQGKPSDDLAKPSDEPAKSFDDPAKPSDDPAKPSENPAKPSEEHYWDQELQSDWFHVPRQNVLKDVGVRVTALVASSN